MGSWGKHNLGDSEDGGMSPEGRVAHARARSLSTTVPGLSRPSPPEAEGLCCLEDDVHWE